MKGMWKVVVAVCLGLCLTACAGNPASSAESSEEYVPEPHEYGQEVYSILTPKDDTLQVEVITSEQNDTDPRLDYTKVVVALIRQVESDPESVHCSENVKQQMRADPDVIPRLHERHNYFVYSISQESDSSRVSCNVGYYDNGVMVVELVEFQNNEGLISITDVDKLLCFLSGGAYAV